MTKATVAVTFVVMALLFVSAFAEAEKEELDLGKDLELSIANEVDSISKSLAEMFNEKPAPAAAAPVQSLSEIGATTERRRRWRPAPRRAAPRRAAPRRAAPRRRAPARRGRAPRRAARRGGRRGRRVSRRRGGRKARRGGRKARRGGKKSRRGGKKSRRGRKSRRGARRGRKSRRGGRKGKKSRRGRKARKAKKLTPNQAAARAARRVKRRGGGIKAQTKAAAVAKLKAKKAEKKRVLKAVAPPVVLSPGGHSLPMTGEQTQALNEIDKYLATHDINSPVARMLKVKKERIQREIQIRHEETKAEAEAVKARAEARKAKFEAARKAKIEAKEADQKRKIEKLRAKIERDQSKTDKPKKSLKKHFEEQIKKMFHVEAKHVEKVDLPKDREVGKHPWVPHIIHTPGQETDLRMPLPDASDDWKPLQPLFKKMSDANHDASANKVVQAALDNKKEVQEIMDVFPWPIPGQ